MQDPRLACIDDRLGGIRRILAVTGGKGGIGKSLVSSSLAVALADAGARTGLLDLDLTGPSDHILLGIEGRFPEEEFGVEPPLHHGVRFMSIAHFAGETPAPMRGEDVTNALLELLAITRWGELDFLVIDMPPGLGDAKLDALRLLRRAEFLVVSTPSRIVRETVRRTLRFLGDLGANVLGVLENMQRARLPDVPALAAECGATYLGALPFDDKVEEATGDVERLRRTAFMAALREQAAELT
jgi:ATP-binding protein involved in chromosome partitioning